MQKRFAQVSTSAGSRLRSGSTIGLSHERTAGIVPSAQSRAERSTMAAFWPANPLVHLNSVQSAGSRPSR